MTIALPAACLLEDLLEEEAVWFDRKSMDVGIQHPLTNLSYHFNKYVLLTNALHFSELQFSPP